LTIGKTDGALTMCCYDRGICKGVPKVDSLTRAGPKRDPFGTTTFIAELINTVRQKFTVIPLGTPINK